MQQRASNTQQFVKISDGCNDQVNLEELLCFLAHKRESLIDNYSIYHKRHYRRQLSGTSLPISDIDKNKFADNTSHRCPFSQIEESTTLYWLNKANRYIKNGKHKSLKQALDTTCTDNTKTLRIHLTTISNVLETSCTTHNSLTKELLWSQKLLEKLYTERQALHVTPDNKALEELRIKRLGQEKNYAAKLNECNEKLALVHKLQEEMNTIKDQITSLDRLPVDILWLIQNQQPYLHFLQRSPTPTRQFSMFTSSPCPTTNTTSPTSEDSEQKSTHSFYLNC